MPTRSSHRAFIKDNRANSKVSCTKSNVKVGEGIVSEGKSGLKCPKYDIGVMSFAAPIFNDEMEKIKAENRIVNSMGGFHDGKVTVTVNEDENTIQIKRRGAETINCGLVRNAKMANIIKNLLEQFPCCEDDTWMTEEALARSNLDSYWSLYYYAEQQSIPLSNRFWIASQQICKEF